MEDYSRSTIVQTSAPTAMGQLRAADGLEGFASAAKTAVQNGVQQASALINGTK